ncbi:MAG: CPBP family intramembrane metalloprotease [Deltaproteobacteria bacterium]|nr:CPBP family intramembrane metalloprotease [Candidatus Zymogenaceae bacterium]
MKQRFPGIFFSFVLVILYLFFQAYLGFLGALIGSTGLMILVSISISALAVMIIASKVNREPLEQAVAWGALNLKALLPILTMTVSLAILLSELDNLVATYLIDPARYEDLLWQITRLFPKDSPVDLALVVASVAIIGPAMEEGVFRGVIYRGVASHHGIRFGIVFTAVVFMVIHLNPIQFPATLILGLIYAWMISAGYRTSDTFIAHALHNSISIPFLLELAEVPGMSAAPADELAHVPAGVLAGAGAIFLASIFLVKKLAPERGGDDEKGDTIPSHEAHEPRG